MKMNVGRGFLGNWSSGSRQRSGMKQRKALRHSFVSHDPRVQTYKSFFSFNWSYAEISTNQIGHVTTSALSDWLKFQRSVNCSRKNFYRIGSWPSTWIELSAALQHQCINQVELINGLNLFPQLRPFTVRIQSHLSCLSCWDQSYKKNGSIKKLLLHVTFLAAIFECTITSSLVSSQ